MSDSETIILINDSDTSEGFFRFSTSKPKQFAKLCKRVGGEGNLLDVQVSTQGSKVTSWTCKVPIAYLSKRNWSIGPKRKAAGKAFTPRFRDGSSDDL